MSETYPYPEREHLEPVTDLCGAIDYELSLHAKGEDFHRGVTIIAGMYDGTPIHRSFLQLSRMMALSHAVAGYEQYKHTIDHDFFGGAMFALHSVLRVSDTYTRRQVTFTDLFPNNYDKKSRSYKFESDGFKKNIAAMGEWASKGCVQSLGSEPDYLRAAIDRAAIHAFNDRAKQGLFVAGMMMSKDQTDILRNYYADKDNIIFHGMVAVV